MVKIAQTFAFGRKKANQGGLPGLTIGFFQQSLDSWRGAIKAFKKGVLYHGEDCNRGQKNDPPILEPAFLLVNR